jgi:exodeoxyribonuclease VII small subunit
LFSRRLGHAGRRGAAEQTLRVSDARIESAPSAGFSLSAKGLSHAARRFSRKARMKRMKKPVDSTPPTFEQALTELESIVDSLEKGDMSLEESLTAFERGIGLTRTCQQALDAAEQRVRILTEARPNDELSAELEPFEPHD